MAVLTQPKPTGASASLAAQGSSAVSIDLYWLPLGAGGWFVRLNGRIYEALAARRDGRSAHDLYHSALIVAIPAGRFVIEQAWPIPRGGGGRGVVAEGPVGSACLGALRVLRYEIRSWQDGVIADIDDAVESPRRLSSDVAVAERVLDLVREAPTPVWGRDQLGLGEMWNSNSLISWLIASAGLDVDAVHPPAGGRAPGWDAGVTVARRADPPSTGRRLNAGSPRSDLRVSRDGSGTRDDDHALHGRRKPHQSRRPDQRRGRLDFDLPARVRAVPHRDRNA